MGAEFARIFPLAATRVYFTASVTAANSGSGVEAAAKAMGTERMDVRVKLPDGSVREVYFDISSFFGKS